MAAGAIYCKQRRSVHVSNSYSASVLFEDQNNVCQDWGVFRGFLTVCTEI